VELKIISAYVQTLQDLGLLPDIKYNKGIQRKLSVFLGFKGKQTKIRISTIYLGTLWEPTQV